MGKFRRKSVVVEAVQWFPDRSVSGVVLVADAEPHFKDLYPLDSGILRGGLAILRPGCWIVYDEDGDEEVYAPEEFKALFEPLDARVKP